eukprot:CAMPEP_0119371872 /NCGR_PEP_ID=MMETSP1334-20130426/17959_1 /TAXON_ID=127549 /ORGANISM="Calcidiscus leptoporus, Strain RCC1130" /LENGTH=75 /DNA_ID=CAMNT_0007389233 /DNA_START=567 /DNA_END=794 /DNA_ORIENTATION=+
MQSTSDAHLACKRAQCRLKHADHVHAGAQGSLARAIVLPRSAAQGRIGPLRAIRTGVSRSPPAGSESALPIAIPA